MVLVMAQAYRASYMSSGTPDTLRNAEAMDGPTLTAISAAAKTNSIWVDSCLHENNSSDNGDGDARVYNTQYVVNDVGTLVSSYRKIHLFDITIPAQNINLKESNSIRPGTEKVVVNDTPIGNIGLATCYDVRFPEHAISLLSQNATVLTFPSAFTVPTGRAHWHTLLKARAIESQAFVIAAAQCGQHNEKRQSYGHSLVVSPWGDVLYDGGGYSSDGFDDQQNLNYLGYCDLDLIEETRIKMPIAQHRAAAAI